MKYKVKITVIDKKLYPELQQQYCADPVSGAPLAQLAEHSTFNRAAVDSNLTWGSTAWLFVK